MIATLFLFGTGAMNLALSFSSFAGGPRLARSPEFLRRLS